MNKTILYPGTFDPITNGPIDLIKKALKIANKVVVAISANGYKNYLFDPNERLLLVKQSLYKDLKIKQSKVDVVVFNSLTTDLCKKMKSKIILRGLRAVSDFDYEFQLAGMNRKLDSSIETIFLMSDFENQVISSRFVKEIIEFGGDVKKFTTKSVVKALKNKYA